MKIDIATLIGKHFLFLITLCFFFILAYYTGWSIKELLREDIPPLVKIVPLAILIGIVSVILFLKEQKEATS